MSRLVAAAREPVLTAVASVPVCSAAACRPVCGGAPFNVSLTLGRLGAGGALLGCVSEDMFGKQIVSKLTANGVSMDLVQRVPNPSLLAFVSFVDNEPEYAFFTENVADVTLTPDKLPDLTTTPAEMLHLSLGAITLMHEPISTAWYHLFQREKERGLFTSFDPNLRPIMISDVAEYRDRVERWLPVFTLIKVSRADLAYLYETTEEALDVAVSPHTPRTLSPNKLSALSHVTPGMSRLHDLTGACCWPRWSPRSGVLQALSVSSSPRARRAASPTAMATSPSMCAWSPSSWSTRSGRATATWGPCWCICNESGRRAQARWGG